MVAVSVRRPVAPDDLESFQSLASGVERETGHPVLNDEMRRTADDLPADAAVVLAETDDAPVGGLLVTSRHNEPEVTAVAIAVPRGEHELAVTRALLGGALADAVGHGRGREVEVAVFGVDGDRDALLRSLGFTPHRTFLQLRVPLPLAQSPSWPDGVSVRPFVTGRDEDEWLALNRRAFAHDPDQGTWQLADLRAREAEAWFDPEGFLLARDSAGLAGFSWTKVHPPVPPAEPVALGEIYVLGVDPDRQQQGLGRALTIAGLAHLHDRRGTPAGMLFVDAGNEAALGLYRSLGFVTSRTDRTYRHRL